MSGRIRAILFDKDGTLFDFAGGVIAKSPAEGAATQLYVATSPRLQGVSGAYFRIATRCR